MRICGVIFFGVALLGGLDGWPGSAARGATNVEVEAALEKARNYLYKEQSADGTWESEPQRQGRESNNFATQGQWGGRTAIAVYALLASGESPQSDKLKRAIDFLKSAEIDGTYALSMRCQVWLFLPRTDEIKKLMQKDAQVLMRSMQATDDASGHYGYGPADRSYSHSRSQYGLLGVWAATQFDIEVPVNYWRTAEAGWLRNQHASGGWTYKAVSEHPLTPSMTAAGVASLFITQDFLRANEGINCRGNISNPAIDKGLSWIEKNFDLVATDRRYARDFPFPCLYGIERIGVASGIKYFGDIDWYQKGADWLVRVQERDGAWSSGSPMMGKVSDTCFAMLFLSRGRAPVVINKLDYSDGRKPANWNQRPRDAANLVRWLGNSLERDLNWQIVNLRAPVKDLHDAPILYMAGNQPLELNDEQKAKLRLYVEQGGLIVGNADCAAPAFSNSFQRLGGELFPQYEFRELPEGHLIYNNQFKRDRWRTKPGISGLSNGARELMLLIHRGDAGRYWQTRTVKGNEQAWEPMMNILLYANERKNLRYKDEPYWIEPKESAPVNTTIRLARLEYAGNWNPEPAGWTRLAALLRNESKIKLDIETVKLGEGALKNWKLAHLTGTDALTLTDPAKDEIKAFLNEGGTLIVDSAGGSSAFAVSIEPQLQALLGAEPMAALPGDDRIYQLPDGKPMPVQFRAFATKQLGGGLGGRIQAGQMQGRRAVYFSRDDLSVGLVGLAVDGIIGYEPDTATKLMSRMLIEASAGKP